MIYETLHVIANQILKIKLMIVKTEKKTCSKNRIPFENSCKIHIRKIKFRCIPNFTKSALWKKTEIGFTHQNNKKVSEISSIS